MDTSSALRHGILPKIGITMQIIRHNRWYKYIEMLGFDTIEINLRNSRLHFDGYFPEKIKRYTGGYDLTIHSRTMGIFHFHHNFIPINQDHHESQKRRNGEKYLQ